MIVRCVSLRSNFHTSEINSVFIEVSLFYCTCQGVKHVHICLLTNHIFCTPLKRQSIRLLYYRLTATDEPCVHRLHLQTFGPKVRSKNREAAVYVDWC